MIDSAASLYVPMPSLGDDPTALAAQLNSKDPRSIDTVATNFESMFLSLILKEMRQTMGGEGLFGPDPGDVCGGLFDMYLGQHLAHAGGFGLAPVLKRQLASRSKS